MVTVVGTQMVARARVGQMMAQIKSPVTIATSGYQAEEAGVAAAGAAAGGSGGRRAAAGAADAAPAVAGVVAAASARVATMTILAQAVVMIVGTLMRTETGVIWVRGRVTRMRERVGVRSVI